MLTGFSNFIRRQFDFYRTDAVAVYATKYDNSAQPIREELDKLFQGKKQVIFQELDGGVQTIRLKRLTDVKYHFFLMPEEYGRISNFSDYVSLFYGQKLVVIQTVNRIQQRVRDPKPEGLSEFYSRISEVEGNMLTAVRDSVPSHIHKSIVSEVLLYDQGFRAKEYKQRLLHFVDLVPPLKSTDKIESIPEEAIPSSAKKKLKTELYEQTEKMPKDSNMKAVTTSSEDFDTDTKRKLSKK